MAAVLKTKDYSSLTIAVRYYSDPKLMFTVSNIALFQSLMWIGRCQTQETGPALYAGY